MGWEGDSGWEEDWGGVQTLTPLVCRITLALEFWALGPTDACFPSKASFYTRRVRVTGRSIPKKVESGGVVGRTFTQELENLGSTSACLTLSQTLNLLGPP